MSAIWLNSGAMEVSPRDVNLELEARIMRDNDDGAEMGQSAREYHPCETHFGNKASGATE